METDSGDGSKMGSVIEGEENKNQGLVLVTGSPRLQGHRGEQQRDEMFFRFQLVEYNIGSMGKETFDLFTRNFWADGGVEIMCHM